MSSPFEAPGGYAARSNGVDPQRFKQSLVYLLSRRRRGAPTEIERHGSNSRQVLQSYFILLNSVTISESRGSFFDQVFHLIGHDWGRFFVDEL